MSELTKSPPQVSMTVLLRLQDRQTASLLDFLDNFCLGPTKLMLSKQLGLRFDAQYVLILHHVCCLGMFIHSKDSTAALGL